MRNPGGYAFITSPVAHRASLDHGLHCIEVSEGTTEIDTFNCGHCGGCVHSKAGTRADEYFCRNCMRPICGPCADHPCIPFMKQVEASEEKDRRYREMMCRG